MKNSAAPRTQRTRIMMGATLGVVLLGFFKLSYMRSYGQIAERQVKIDKLEAEIKEKKRVLTELSRVQATTAASGAQSDIDKYLEANNKFAGLLQTLSGDGLVFTMNRLAAEKQETSRRYFKTQFTLDIDTSFLTLGNFIDKLEHSDRLAEVKTLEVTRIGRELKKCSAKIEFYGYVARKSP